MRLVAVLTSDRQIAFVSFGRLIWPSRCWVYKNLPSPDSHPYSVFTLILRQSKLYNSPRVTPYLTVLSPLRVFSNSAVLPRVAVLVFQPSLVPRSSFSSPPWLCGPHFAASLLLRSSLAQQSFPPTSGGPLSSSHRPFPTPNPPFAPHHAKLRDWPKTNDLCVASHLSPLHPELSSRPSPTWVGVLGGQVRIIHRSVSRFGCPDGVARSGLGGPPTLPSFKPHIRNA